MMRVVDATGVLNGGEDLKAAAIDMACQSENLIDGKLYAWKGGIRNILVSDFFSLKISPLCLILILYFVLPQLLGYWIPLSFGQRQQHQLLQAHNRQAKSLYLGTVRAEQHSQLGSQMLNP
jgi:hypothetical protein